MRKWILLALVNWLRKPANRQKAKNAWNEFRGSNVRRRPSNQARPTPRDSSTHRANDTFDR